MNPHGAEGAIARRLERAGIEAPMREARILHEHFGGEALERAISSRENRVPMAQILGYRWFWKDRFKVTKAVLDPRPDSERMIEIALEWAKDNGFDKGGQAAIKLLDLGCGSGALGLSFLREFPEATCRFVDLAPEALDIARQNATALGLGARSEFSLSNWLEQIDGEFNLILCNPPYIAKNEMAGLPLECGYEPRHALCDEGDGLSAFRALAPNIARHLSGPEAAAFFEHGFTQQSDVAQIFEEQGFVVRKFNDINEKPRICEVRLAP